MDQRHVHPQKHSHAARHLSYAHQHVPSSLGLETREILPRDADSSDCDPDISSCEKPTANNNAVVIALSVA